MNSNVPFSQRLRRLFLGETHSLAFAVGVLSFLLGLGFFLANSQTENYDLINSQASQAMWGILYMIYAVFRLASAMYRFSSIQKLTLTFAGMVLWILLLLSFTVYDATPLRPTELMLGLPVLIEFWFAIVAIDCIRAKRYGRKNDGK